MTAESYTDEELERLERVGRRRTVTHLLDFNQRHLTEFSAEGR